MSFMPNSSKSSESGQRTGNQTMSIGGTSSESSTKTMGKRQGKRPGRKASKIDERVKLERSRQSARECRARKKLRYQYLEELVLHREKAVFALRDELEAYKQWCSKLDNQEQMPESLLKAIVNEDLSQQRSQINQARRCMRQQKDEENLQFSSTSSYSSESSSPPQLEQWQQHHQQPTGSGSSLDLHNTLPTQLTPSSQPQNRHQQSQSSSLSQQECHQQQLQHKPSTGTTSLPRQMGFDLPQTVDIPRPHEFVCKTTTNVQVPGPSQSHDSMLSTLTQFEQQQNQQKVQHLHHYLEQQRAKIAKVTHQPPYSVHSSHHSQRPQFPFRTNVKSEQPITFEQSSEKYTTFSIIPRDIIKHSSGVMRHGSETRRARSFSNPASMVSFPRPGIRVTSTQTLTRSPQALEPTQINPMTSNQQVSQRFGLFSGSLVGTKSSNLVLNIPTSLTVEESSSSDENTSEKQLFQSVFLSHKRALSDGSEASGNLKRSIASTNRLQSASSIPYFDPKEKLSSLTTMHCFSTARTSNTSSPSSFGLLCSSGLHSPTPISRYSSKASSTASSSATPSPAPLSSISSLLELSASSPRMSSSIFDQTMEVADSTSMAQSSNLDSFHCSTTDLSASIDEPIPELYSFLKDLQEGGLSSLTSRLGSSSNHSIPMTLTPKSQDQPSTPDPQFMNVPKIIDEFLESDDQDL